MAIIFAEVTESECIMQGGAPARYRSTSRFTVRSEDRSVLTNTSVVYSTWPIWLRAKVNKQISLCIAEHNNEKDIKSSLVYQPCTEWDDFSLITNYLLWIAQQTRHYWFALRCTASIWSKWAFFHRIWLLCWPITWQWWNIDLA